VKVFKVEMTNVKKEYASVEIEASDRASALEIAQKMAIKDFDFHEETKAHEITAKRPWGFFDLFLGITKT
jgi:hypothetical protein